MDKKTILKINKIKKSFSEKIILDEVSFSLAFGEKVALIGTNGSGKSTLAKILAEEIKADEGSIEIFKNFKVSYLPQEINQNILVDDYLEKNSKTFKILEEFCFRVEEIFQRKISSLSGGEKSKIFLTKIATEKSPIIILDEPTNNLDEEGLEFLERIIKNSNSAFLIISHNRNFLDQTVSKVIELDEFSHQIKIYDGNYSDYKIEKERFLAREEELYIANQKIKEKFRLEQKRQSIRSQRKMRVGNILKDKNKISANRRIDGVQSSAGKNLKRIQNKINNFQKKERLIQKRPLKIDFSEMKKSGQKVLEVRDLKIKYGFSQKINLEIFAGERVLISGLNGSGKSTFLKTLLGKVEKKSGDFFWGVNLKIGYLPQDFLQEKNKDDIFLNYFLKESDKNETDGRKILARFGFSEKEINLKISELSPGLRGRGQIALMLANNPNVLILDEPTNNLDLEVLEKLEKALKKYQGTIIFVSHDKYFIEKIKLDKNIHLGLL